MPRPRSFDEAEVIQAARDRFRVNGYAATSLDDLTAATGLGRGSLYGAFGDKQRLFLRAFEQYCVAAVEEVRRALDGPAPALDRLRSYLVSAVDDLRADSAHVGCMLAKGTAELAGQDEKVAETARRAFDEIERLLAACVEEGQRQGDIDPRSDPYTLAGLLLAVLRGMESLAKAGKDIAGLRRSAEAAIALLPRP